jgi:hypothetical protein
MIKQVFFLTLIAGTTIPVAPQDTASLPLEQIVRTLAKNEEEVQKVVQQYTFRRDIRLEELNQPGNAVGEYHAASDIAFDNAGNRREQSLGQPQVTLKRITLTGEDFDALRTLENSPFTTRDIEDYDIRIIRNESVSGIPCHVLELIPKSTTKSPRYSLRTLWVSETDLKIVKAVAKISDIRQRGGAENLFPQMEMSREKTEGNWLPASMTASDTLRFSTGSVGIRWVVKYDNYRKN